MAERSGWGRRTTDRIARVVAGLLILLVVELFILLIAQFVPVGVDSSQNEQINRIPLEAAYDTREASFNGCVRANVRLTAQVRAAYGQAAGNRARADAWRELAKFPLDPALDSFTQGQITANEDEAAAAQDYAETLIRSQAAVAKDPDAKDPVDRAATDCRGTFPLPAHRGDPLPEPTKP